MFEVKQFQSVLPLKMSAGRTLYSSPQVSMVGSTWFGPA